MCAHDSDVIVTQTIVYTFPCSHIQEENVRDSESSNLHTLFMAQLYMTEVRQNGFVIGTRLLADRHLSITTIALTNIAVKPQCRRLAE